MPDHAGRPDDPRTAISAFTYLRAVQADDVDAAREFASAERRTPELLVDVADRIVARSPRCPAQRPASRARRLGLLTAPGTRH